MKPGDTSRTEFLYAIESNDDRPLGNIFRDRRTGRYGVQYLDHPVAWSRSMTRWARSADAACHLARKLAPRGARLRPL